MYQLPINLSSAPAEYLRASEAGANLGLQAAHANVSQRDAQQRQDLAAQELAQRDRDALMRQQLAYDTLGSQDVRAAMALAAAQQRADETNRYRYEALGQRTAGAQESRDLRRAHWFQQAMQNEMANRLGIERLDRSDTRAAAANDLRERLANRARIVNQGAGQTSSYDPVTGLLTELSPARPKAPGTVKSQSERIAEFDLKHKLAAVDAQIKALALPAWDDKSDKAEAVRKEGARLRGLHESLLGQLTYVGVPVSNVPVAGGRALADEASMNDLGVDLRSAADSLSLTNAVPTNAVSTATGKRFEIRPRQ